MQTPNFISSNCPRYATLLTSLGANIMREVETERNLASWQGSNVGEDAHCRITVI
jgi:hypothetical protein